MINQRKSACALTSGSQPTEPPQKVLHLYASATVFEVALCAQVRAAACQVPPSSYSIPELWRKICKFRTCVEGYNVWFTLHKRRLDLAEGWGVPPGIKNMRSPKLTADLRSVTGAGSAAAVMLRVKRHVARESSVAEALCGARDGSDKGFV